MKSAKLSLDGKDYEFPIVAGTEGEVGIDISSLRAKANAKPGSSRLASCTRIASSPTSATSTIRN